MKKLTKRKGNYVWWNGNQDYSTRDRYAKVLDRLAAYEDTGLTPEQAQELAKAKAKGRLMVLPCKVGDSYTGICREIVPGKKGWKTKEWLDSGVVVGFEVIAELTAEKAGHNHSRNIDESGETWFVGEGHCEAAEKALGGADDGSSKDE